MKLAIEGVGKRYGSFAALNDFSLTVPPGILGLLGPNGAGKSTLMRILATITKPSSGRVVWDGVDVARDPNALREILGYLPQDFGVYPNLNAVEFLEYLAAARGLSGSAVRKRIDGLLDLVNLADAARRPLGGWSGGMKQRLGIAQALLNDPKLLIVDEPTVGLDPGERIRFRNLLAELSGDRIVILSTHIVSDVEAQASRIALIHRGRLMADTTIEALVAGAEGAVWEWTVPADEWKVARAAHAVSGVTRRGSDVVLRIVSETPPAAAARPVPPTLEDAYIKATALPAPVAA